MNKIVLVLTCFLVPLVTGCEKVPGISDGGEPDDNVVPVERHDIKLSASQKAFVTKGNSFAMNLFKEVFAQEEGSFMVSPLSVEYTLAMLCNGAAGNTRSEVVNLLGFEDGQIEEVNAFYGYLTEELHGADNTVLLNLANALLYNTQYAGLRKDYVSILENYYDALVNGFDFYKDNAAALSYVNGWAKEQTSGMIPELLKELSPSAYLVLMNALYFKGTWNAKNEFKESNTKPGDFYLENGGRKRVNYMYQESLIDYGYSNYCQIVSLMYGNGAFAMDLLVPHESVSPGELLSSLAPDYYKQMRVNQRVKVKLPVFETESDRIDLVKILDGMGMKSAFDPEKADFSPMTEDKVFVSDIFQKSKIKVNEKGSEAAAVTVVSFVASAGPNFTPPPIPEVNATSPFLYVIRETSTDTILFMGVFRGK